VTESKSGRAAESLEHARYHDAFTGLESALLMDQLDRLLRDHASAVVTVCVAAIDIDRFS
jgi:GGDEF domain-containing protein